MKQQRIVILGLRGMVGHKLFFELSEVPELHVFATSRSLEGIKEKMEPRLLNHVITGVDAHDISSIVVQLEKIKPDVVINCIGITKKLTDARHPRPTIEINALYPHLLADACKKLNIRLVQIATDCVFSGTHGNYTEDDQSDAEDLYGRTKFLGEVYYPHCLTLRTSFIGHELGSSHGLLEWFLAQQKEAVGYTKALYSGMPTVEIARILATYVLPNPQLHGLYHVSADPISKYKLLQLIAKQYKKDIVITKNTTVKIDRTLDSSRFRTATGYAPIEWSSMVEKMHQDYTDASYYDKNR